VERIGLAPGAEIGGYTVVAPLGAGGMGTVYRALDGGGHAVALKLLHPVERDDESRARLLREVAALQRLRHPAVAAVLDAEADSTEAFLVTELVDGTDLEDLVREDGPLDAESLLALASGLRDALNAVHAAGVVHRDLKPSNVLMTGDGPVLIDFGLAQGEADTRLTSVGLVAGTPGYLAPEMLDGDDPGESVDWWGWAALLAFAATGRPPFGRGRVTTVLARARAGKPDLAGLGQLTRAAIRGALAPEPPDRTAPDDVVAALTVVAAEGDRLPRPRKPRTGQTRTVPVADDSATSVLTGADAVGTTALAADGAPAVAAAAVATPTAVVPNPHDGRTRAVPAGLLTAPDEAAPTVLRPDETLVDGVATSTLGPGYDDYDEPSEDDYWDDDPQYQAVEWIEGDLDASSGEPVPEPAYLRPHVPGRWVTQVALAVLVTVCGARRPGLTLEVALGFFLAARAYGSTVEAMHGRREKRGVRSSDGWVAALTAPWHLVRSVLGIVPSLLVAASSLVIVVGVAWWFVGNGRWTIGDNRAGHELTGTTAAWLTGLAVLLAVLLVWFGPLSRMTRVGTRRLLEMVSPRRLGALVLVVVVLAVAAVVATGILHADPIVWHPVPVPTIPVK
jgi:hypothetical protein